MHRALKVVVLGEIFAVAARNAMHRPRPIKPLAHSAPEGPQAHCYNRPGADKTQRHQKRLEPQHELMQRAKKKNKKKIHWRQSLQAYCYEHRKIEQNLCFGVTGVCVLLHFDG